MKILLINIDSTIPNLALEKIKLYHRQKGDKVIENFPLLSKQCDKIYVSCVFDYNKHLCKEWEGIAEIGGSGYDLTKKLPPEIDSIKPRINLGFTTRGCIRNCEFCIVRRKEGKIYIEGDIYDLWDGKSKLLTILDNNILALPEHFMKISQQLKKEHLMVDFNQGLDFRLLTDDIIKELFSLRHYREIRFAFDDLAYKPTVLKVLEKLRKNGLKDWQTRWYVYVGVKDSFETVMERIDILRNAKQLVYLMRDVKVHDNLEYRELSGWCNYPGLFKKAHYFDIKPKNVFTEQNISKIESQKQITLWK